VHFFEKNDFFVFEKKLRFQSAKNSEKTQNIFEKKLLKNSKKCFFKNTLFAN
jgi:hypothetical protein